MSHAARPMVNAGNMIWDEIVKPNCIRDKRSAVGSLAVILSAHMRIDLGIERLSPSRASHPYAC
jgi:hypothetical protein